VTPKTLGQLSSNQPAPTGLVQCKRGAVEGTIRWNNTVPAQGLQDGAGQLMALYLTTPPQRGWWLLHAQALWLQIEPDAWTSIEWGIDLNVPDLTGRIRHKLQTSQHAFMGWITTHIDCAYFLEASTAYSCVMMWLYSSGWNQEYHCNGMYHYIEGEFVGEGAY
jgi:hypothetical protein